VSAQSHLDHVDEAEPRRENKAPEQKGRRGILRRSRIFFITPPPAYPTRAPSAIFYFSLGRQGAVGVSEPCFVRGAYMVSFWPPPQSDERPCVV
jgi:hypothetical protein